MLSLGIQRGLAVQMPFLEKLGKSGTHSFTSGSKEVSMWEKPVSVLVSHPDMQP